MRSRARGKSSIRGSSRAGSSFLGLLLLVFCLLLVLAFLRRRCRLRLWRQCPVSLEDVAHFLRNPFIGDEDADFATPVELELSQALTPDECGAAVADYRSDVKPQVRQLPGLDAGRPLSELSEHANLDPGLGAFGKKTQHQPVADLRVIDQQLLLRLLDERCQQLARAFRTDDQLLVAGRIRLARAVGL